MAYGDKDRKTLPPTPRKKREARKDGNIPKSPELAIWGTLFVASYLLPTFIGMIGGRVLGLVTSARSIMAHPDQNKAVALFGTGLGTFAVTALTIAAIIGVVAAVITVTQTGFVFSTKAAKPNFKRINPWTGLKGYLSPKAFWQAGKAFLKLAVVAVMAFHVVYPVAHMVIGARPVTLEPLASLTGQAVIILVRQVAMAGLVLAAIDYLINRRRISKSLMMSREEVKEENKNQEGDPVTKRRIRRMQVRMSRMRMMAAIADADVVITNPTHYLVALQYSRETHVAPLVVAKGEGELALRLKAEAFRVGVAVVEDPPLARALYGACEVDQLIPGELYKAVAHLLAFVYRLSRDARLLGVAFRTPVSSMFST